MTTFPVFSRTGGRCDDCKADVAGTLYIVSVRDGEVEHKACFIHMKWRQKYLKKLAREAQIRFNREKV